MAADRDPHRPVGGGVGAVCDKADCVARLEAVTGDRCGHRKDALEGLRDKPLPAVGESVRVYGDEEVKRARRLVHPRLERLTAGRRLPVDAAERVFRAVIPQPGKTDWVLE